MVVIDRERFLGFLRTDKREEEEEEEGAFEDSICIGTVTGVETTDCGREV